MAKNTHKFPRAITLTARRRRAVRRDRPCQAVAVTARAGIVSVVARTLTILAGTHPRACTAAAITKHYAFISTRRAMKLAGLVTMVTLLHVLRKRRNREITKDQGCYQKIDEALTDVFHISHLPL